MKFIIDTDEKTLTEQIDGHDRTLNLYSKEAFELLSKQWVKVGWNQKHIYTFTWMGRPIIQLPEDMVRVQELIYRLGPDVIVETGVAHGGSLVFYASLCKLMKKGRVIGIDVEIRPHNRKAIEAHEMFPLITLVEGSSIDPKIVSQVRGLIQPNESVLVLLDSNHSKQHVADELKAYSPLVTPGSYIVSTDGIMKFLDDVPRGNPEWNWDNPDEAAADFAKEHPEFDLEPPKWQFNESNLTENISHWPAGWLTRR